mgnify:CR=1 FL=1
MKILFFSLLLILQVKVLNALEFQGKFEQGSFILGKTSPNSKIQVDSKKIRVSKDGFFAFGLDRDRKNDVVIKVTKNGETKTIEWENRDIFVVPCWYPHKFEADTEATIFSFSDKVVQTKLGLFRERRGNK